MFERLPLSPVRPWAIACRGTSTRRAVMASVQDGEPCGNQLARQVTGGAAETRHDVRPHTAAAGRAAGVERQHLTRDALDARAIRVRGGHAHAHLARAGVRALAERAPGVVAEHAQYADQVDAEREPLAHATLHDIGGEARPRLRVRPAIRDLTLPEPA